MAIQNTLSTLTRPQRPLDVVLIGSSLDEESDAVVRAGLAVARATGARIHLVHAVRIEPFLVSAEAGLGRDLSREQIAWREVELHRQAERLGIGASELAGCAVLAGAPHRVLTDTASAAGAQLIVIGSTRFGPLAVGLLGSTADRVLRKASCPVLLVRGELAVPPRRVLAPVDLGSLSGDAFRCGLSLLAQIAHGEEITVRAVHALSFLDTLALKRQKPAGISAEQVERRGAEELRRFVLENRAAAPFRVESAVLPGEARCEILRDLEEHPVDLVVMGTHGRGGLDRMMLGSVASTVARKAPCSVLLISPEATLDQGIADAVTAQTAPVWHREVAVGVGEERRA